MSIAAAAVAAGESVALVVPGLGVLVACPALGVPPLGIWAEPLRWWKGRLAALKFAE